MCMYIPPPPPPPPLSSASRATGHGFYYLRGAAAMLELALVKLAMQKATARVSHRYMCATFTVSVKL